MRVTLKIKIAQFKLYLEKLHEQAKRIALAVVITQYILVGAYAYGQYKGIFEFLQPKTIVIEVAKANTLSQEAPKAQELPEVSKIDTDKIADTIYTLESSRGKNNYSKCKAIGKVNNIGYGIPGNGQYMCFKNHAEEMETLKAWINKHIAEGMNEKEMMCHYSGNNYDICQ